MTYVTATHTAVEYPRADTTGMDAAPVRVVLIQEVNKHDLLLVDHVGSLSYVADTLRSGSPVHAEMRSEHGSKDWYGYVDSVSPTVGGYTPESVYLNDNKYENSASSQVVCVGVTYPLKKSVTGITPGRTTSAIVADIVAAERLMPCVSPSPMLQSALPLDRSAWQSIVHMGQTSGRLTFTTGTTVNWLSPDDIMTHYAVCAPRLYHISTAVDLSDPLAMVSWEEDVTDNNAHDVEAWRSATSLAGTDPVTGTIIEQSVGTGLFPRTMTDTARSSTSVQTKLDAAYSLAFSQSARITGPGNLYVAAGQPVFVKSPSGYQWWLVRKVEHVWYPKSLKHRMQVTLMAHEALPQPALARYPQVSLSRTSPVPGSLTLEHSPILSGGSQPLVEGAGAWGVLDRWMASTHI